MFDFSNTQKSHMPFVAADPLRNFAPEEFCCLPVGGIWKLHHLTDGQWRRVPTGLPEDAIECSPTAEYEDGMWKVSFIGGGAETMHRFRLWRLFGLDAGAALTLCAASVGYVQKRRVVHAMRSGSLLIEDPEWIREVVFDGLEHFYRASYNPNNPRELLISGKLLTGELFSWIYRPGVSLESLTADGAPAYKAAFFNGSLFYARQTGDGFEDRQIVRAGTIVRTPLDFSAIVRETRRPNNTGISGNDEEFE